MSATMLPMLIKHLLLQGPATDLLEVEVQQAPALLQEASPAVWLKCHDFTGGEAPRLRCLVCLGLHCQVTGSSACMLHVHHSCLHLAKQSWLATHICQHALVN